MSSAFFSVFYTLMKSDDIHPGLLHFHNLTIVSINIGEHVWMNVGTKTNQQLFSIKG